MNFPPRCAKGPTKNNTHNMKKLKLILLTIPILAGAAFALHTLAPAEITAALAVAPLIAFGAVTEGATRVQKSIADRCRQQRTIRGLGAIECQQRNALALEAALIYRKEIIEPGLDEYGHPRIRPDYLVAPLEAATDADTLGALTGTLVTQQMLEFFRYDFPAFDRFSTDFKAEPASLNQTSTTRKLVVPAVRSFNNTLAADGRPTGWELASAGQTVDVPITLDELVGVPIPFSLATLSSTQRELFKEVAPAGSYALAKYFLAKIFGICTAGNFNAYAAVTAAGDDGIVKVPVAYPTYACGLVDFSRAKITEMATAFSCNEVPHRDRTLLLNAQYYGKLSNDASLTTFFAGQQNPEIVYEGRLPKMSGFTPIEVPTFPGTNNRGGIALHKAGLLAKTRLPANLNTCLPGAANGSVTQVTEPQSGLTLMLIEYVSPGNYAEILPCVIIGAAKGDPRGGLVLTQ